MKLHYDGYLNHLAGNLRKTGNFSEVLLWDELKKKKLGVQFLRQRPIGGYIVDFYCHSLNLAIEIDGSASHDAKIEKDLARQRSLESQGIIFLRFRDSDVRYNLEGIVKAIKQEILRLANSPPPL